MAVASTFGILAGPGPFNAWPIPDRFNGDEQFRTASFRNLGACRNRKAC